MDLYSFVYRGVLADEALRQLAKPGETRQDDPAATIRERLPLEVMDDALVLDAQKMAWVYIAIAAFENSARAFIEERLTEKVGESWWDTAVSDGIKRKADTRRTEEEQIRWHSARGGSKLSYVELGDLTAIIQQNIESFKPLVPTVEWARGIFTTLERSRNVVMHSGQLKMLDVERVAMNIRDWFTQVGG